MTTFNCANLKCGRPLEPDHVTLVTTAHVRRFCSVECIIEGYEAHLEALHQWVFGGAEAPASR